MSTVLNSAAGTRTGRVSVGRWACLVMLFGLLIVLYADSWESMRHVWDTPTYTHGYVVPLIAAWLAWGRRETLGRIVPATSWTALPVMALVGLFWLAGELAGVNAAQHFAIVGMAVLLVPLTFGWPRARQIAFPLGFLFFAVPFGDFLLPVMMQATAKVTIALVRLSGVPIYQEGLSFVLPSGAWQIIEECSGQRYLIAAVPLACLFAWISFRRNSTRWLFVLFAIAVALLANWIRAWGIVMLGHISDMKIATGVDHLIYGWGFFGVVMGLLFWMGSRWTEAPLPDEVAGGIACQCPSQRRPDNPKSGGIGGVSAALLAGALMLAVWPALASHLLARDAAPFDLALLYGGRPGFAPAHRDASTPADGQFDPAYVGAHQEVRLVSTDASPNAVFIWIGSYEHQREGSEMVQHANSIRSRAVKHWTLVSERVPQPVAAGAANVNVTEYVLTRDARRLLVWRGFVVDGRSTASEAEAKMLTAWRVARGRGDRSMAAILWTSLDDEPQARARLTQALTSLSPVLLKEGSQP